ncbi:MAG: hypothetical protein E6J83_00420 [Deltaproteobacteria bacterium]|nr:MAG: hypothetical protein E6J83_00420 [Deltaproteobacteria bacterium]
MSELKGEIMKQPLRITIVGIVCLLGPSMAVAPKPGAATLSYSGTITGFFDSPVLSGDFLQAGTHLPVFRDNTTAAVGSGFGTSSVAWNDDNGGTVAPSALTFTGNSFSDVAPDRVFALGTLTYLNGPNSPASLIFGVTMHLSAGGGITPFAGPVAIVSTQNANIDRVADADLLFFSNFEIPSTLAAFENSAVTAIVYGKIADTLQLEVTSISLAQGEADHGCVVEGPAVGSTGPCASVCGDVCAAVALAVAGPLCESEQLPAGLNRRIRQALRLLEQVASTDSERKAKSGVTRVMERLQRSATIARGAAKRGRISAACAEAVGRAVGNARSQAEPWLSTSDR